MSKDTPDEHLHWVVSLVRFTSPLLHCWLSVLGVQPGSFHVGALYPSECPHPSVQCSLQVLVPDLVLWLNTASQAAKATFRCSRALLHLVQEWAFSYEKGEVSGLLGKSRHDVGLSRTGDPEFRGGEREGARG